MKVQYLAEYIVAKLSQLPATVDQSIQDVEVNEHTLQLYCEGIPLNLDYESCRSDQNVRGKRFWVENCSSKDDGTFDRTVGEALHENPKISQLIEHDALDFYVIRYGLRENSRKDSVTSITGSTVKGEMDVGANEKEVVGKERS